MVADSYAIPQTAVSTADSTAANSTVLSKIDFTEWSAPASMRVDITTSSTNKCWGHVHTYIANSALEVGRVVGLHDPDSDAGELKVDYLLDYSNDFAETRATCCPIGITQKSANAGEAVDVCVYGYTTATSAHSKGNVHRGSLVLTAEKPSGNGNLSTFGKVRVNTEAQSNEAHIGVLAQSGPVVADGPVLIFFRGFYLGA